ncbi:MAG TPA: leishmanolysin-related zinc metalloendopeptidase [Gemmatimonadaceae bacterium]|nr:leishmanolysin-related zinc metalloendopeptidase [Gemmatimonadaceae bacterium]
MPVPHGPLASMSLFLRGTVTKGHLTRLLGGVALVAAGISCSDGPTQPGEPPVGPPASVVVVSGASQSALAGTNVGPITVQVRDASGRGVAGATVSFSVTSGEGTIASTPVQTDATGTATAPAWRLGKAAIPQVLFVNASGLSATVNATVKSDYTVDLRFFGPAMPGAASEAFSRAAARVRASVIGDVIDFPTPSSAIDLDTNCGVTGITAFSEGVDDVIIYASVAPKDGPGKILASAGPCFIRSADAGSATLIGVMNFDSEDLDVLITGGRLNDVIFHEMLHVVGVGTLWNRKSLLAGGGSTESRFTGPLALAACHALGGQPVCNASVPVENTGGAGTADGHWREATFNDELMTGFIEAPGLVNPLSSITIQSLADLGYIVNNSASDPYSIPGLSAVMNNTRASILADIAQEPAAWEVVKRPILEMSRSGSIRKVNAQ